MKTPKGKEVFVFDNEGETFDRFTIITKEDAMIFGASCHPFNPQGFGQFCGDVSGHLFDAPKTVKKYVENARKLGKEWLGKEITIFSDLPEDVQEYVEQVAE